MTAQGILSGNEILHQIESGGIRIDPLDVRRINPASYDLTLGPHVAVYAAAVEGSFAASVNTVTHRKEVPGEKLLAAYESFRGRTLFETDPGVNCLDAKRDNPIIRYEMDERGLLLRPGIGYLMHTAERVWTDKFAPVLDGKSSIGRLFITIHVTAGYGDPNFSGQYTLEVAVTHPVIVYPGMRIGQVRFHTVKGAITLYDGNYRGEDAVGPISSKAFRQLLADGLTHESLGR
jgi:deoxycytidine triphosphate deaminase